MKINACNKFRAFIYASSVCFCLIVIFSDLTITHAKENRSDSPQRGLPTPEGPKASGTDGNQPAPNDPNNTSEENEQGDDGDIFELKISTYISINQAYSRIFTPELITEDGLVEYGTLRRKRFDVIDARRELKKINPAILMNLSREERIAFWINTYNFCTIKLILENYPIQPKWYMIIYPSSSIMQITGAWDKEYHEIQREEYSLREIEQDFLLTRYKDPRICFALSNAAVGGPALRNEPYKAEQLDEQLDDQVRKYLSTDKGMRLDKDTGTLFLSNIFQIHKKTFLDSEWANIKKFRDRKDEERVWLNFILPYLSEQGARYLENEDVRIKFIDFNWHLNEAP